MRDEDVAPRGRGRAEVAPRLDAVGDDLMFSAVKRLHALDDDSGGPCPGNLRPHGDEAVGKIHHFRFAGGIFNDGFAVREDRGHHEVFRTRHRHHVGDDARALQARRRGVNVAVINLHLGPERSQPLDVLIHRTGADGASAGETHPRGAEARHEGAERQNRRAHGLDEFVGRNGARQRPRVEDHFMAFPPDLHAHAFQKKKHRAHVGKIGHVRELQVSGREK